MARIRMWDERWDKYLHNEWMQQTRIEGRQYFEGDTMGIVLTTKRWLFRQII